jgi:NAD(P)-dependent dehydrogenase (short-subunit alcohol dehydrogenase family)
VSTVRRWFVTGASSGIGRHLVEQVLALGDRVVATVRRPDALSDLQGTYGDALQVERLDLRDPIDGVVERTTASGPVDVVVNNAGYSIIGALEELTTEQISEQLITMLHAPIAITRAFLPVLRANGGGHLLQISSAAGQSGLAGNSIYSAAKWGLEGLTEAVAQEVAQFGIHCTIVEPALVRTGFGAAVQYANELPPYATGVVAGLREFLGRGDEVFTGDPAKVAAILIELTRMPEPPLRLALGENAFVGLGRAFESRAQSLRDFEKLTRSVALDVH